MSLSLDQRIEKAKTILDYENLTMKQKSMILKGDMDFVSLMNNFNDEDMLTIIQLSAWMGQKQREEKKKQEEEMRKHEEEEMGKQEEEKKRRKVMRKKVKEMINETNEKRQASEKRDKNQEKTYEEIRQEYEYCLNDVMTKFNVDLQTLSKILLNTNRYKNFKIPELYIAYNQILTDDYKKIGKDTLNVYISRDYPENQLFNMYVETLYDYHNYDINEEILEKITCEESIKDKNKSLKDFVDEIKPEFRGSYKIYHIGVTKKEIEVDIPTLKEERDNILNKPQNVTTKSLSEFLLKMDSHLNLDIISTLNNGKVYMIVHQEMDDDYKNISKDKIEMQLYPKNPQKIFEDLKKEYKEKGKFVESGFRAEMYDLNVYTLELPIYKN